MRIVLDTNILIRAFHRKGGLASQVLRYSLSDTLILSNEILYELARVLRYPRIVKAHKQSEGEVYSYVEELRRGATVVALDVTARSLIRDLSDAIVIQTAVSGDADVLCTLDRDFFSPPASTFLESCGIAVMTDVQLIQRLRQ